jgi:hypothetical protein
MRRCSIRRECIRIWMIGELALLFWDEIGVDNVSRIMRQYGLLARHLHASGACISLFTQEIVQKEAFAPQLSLPDSFAWWCTSKPFFSKNATVARSPDMMARCRRGAGAGTIRFDDVIEVGNACYHTGLVRTR